MKSEKLKRFRVTQTLRFPSNIMKGFFYAGLVLLPLGLVVAVLSFFIPALEGVRGIAVIAAALSVIWLFAAKRWSWWCYVSDHELSEKEKKEFPEFVEKGVFYFSDADNTVEELKKFLPPRFLDAF